MNSGIYRDDRVKGLMVVCHRTTKTYAVQGDVRRNGRHIRTVRVKIDRVDRIGLAEARRRAKSLMSTIQSGVDPTERPNETGITVEQAMEAHLAERDLRPATISSCRYNVGFYLKPFRRRAIADISRAECREHLETIITRHGRTCAGGAFRTLRSLINTAMRIDETIPENPVCSLRLPAPRKREVGELNIAEWWAKTETLSAVRRDLQRTFLLTGARKLSILSVRRNDIDLQAKTLTFTHLKTGGSLIFPMGAFLADLLARRLEADAPLKSEWLWPSATSKSGRVVEPKEQRRDLPPPHALRHHARTLMIAAGLPYAESALLLGQKLPGASGGYVHASHLTETLRPMAQKFEDLILCKAVQQEQQALSG
jgi:integrase